MKLTAIVQGERVEIEMNRVGGHSIEANVGTRRYTLESKTVGPGIFWLSSNNRSLEVSVTLNGGAYVVSIEGRRIPVEMVDARTALRRAAHPGQHGAAEIRSPMPGKIVKVLVAEGAQVQPNEGILVMEAMKMQNEIKSPKKGTVRKLAVVDGAAVNSGDLLAVVE